MRQSNQFDVELGRRILRIRRMRGWSRGRLAALLGLSSRDLLGYEKGQKRMQPDLLLRLAAILGVRISAFFADIRMPNATVDLGVRLPCRHASRSR